MKSFPVSDRIRKNWAEKKIEIKDKWLLVPEKLIEEFSLNAERLNLSEECLFWMLHPQSIGERFSIDFVKTHRQMFEANIDGKNYVLWRNEKARDDIFTESLPEEVEPEPLFIPAAITQESAIPVSLWNKLPELAVTYGKDLDDVFLVAESKADPKYLSELKLSSSRGAIRLTSVRTSDTSGEYGLWWNAGKTKDKPNRPNYSNVKGKLQFEKDPPNCALDWRPPNQRIEGKNQPELVVDELNSDATPSTDTSEVEPEQPEAPVEKKDETSQAAVDRAEPVAEADTVEEDVTVEPVG